MAYAIAGGFLDPAKATEPGCDDVRFFAFQIFGIAVDRKLQPSLAAVADAQDRLAVDPVIGGIDLSALRIRPGKSD